MANESNLIPFKKGQSGNINGRPKGTKNRSTIAKYWLDTIQEHNNPITGIDEHLSNEDIITIKLILQANSGCVKSYKALMDSAYGHPKQQIEETINNSGLDLSGLTTDELREYLRLLGESEN